MKLLHFSDIHIGLVPQGMRWLLDKRILGEATQFLRRRRRQHLEAVPALLELARAIQPDVIACTGDLTAVAAPREFERALELLEPFRKLVGEGRFFYVPGNHDAYVNDSAVVLARRRAVERLNGLDGGGALPLERTVDSVRFFCLDGAVPMPPWKSGGCMAARMMDELEQRLAAVRKADERRVVLSHFPVTDAGGRRLGWRRRAEGDERLGVLIAKGAADVLLCGHIHRPFANSVGACRQVCAGSLTLSRSAFLLELESGIAVKKLDV